MKEIIDKMIRSAYDEIEGVQKYMTMCEEMKKAGMECPGVLRDMAHDEYTHAMYMISMIEMHDEVPQDLMDKWEECKRMYQNA